MMVGPPTSVLRTGAWHNLQRARSTPSSQVPSNSNEPQCWQDSASYPRSTLRSRLSHRSHIRRGVLGVSCNDSVLNCSSAGSSRRTIWSSRNTAYNAAGPLLPLTWSVQSLLLLPSPCSLHAFPTMVNASEDGCGGHAEAAVLPLSAFGCTTSSYHEDCNRAIVSTHPIVAARRMAGGDGFALGRRGGGVKEHPAHHRHVLSRECLKIDLRLPYNVDYYRTISCGSTSSNASGAGNRCRCRCRHHFDRLPQHA